MGIVKMPGENLDGAMGWGPVGPIVVDVVDNRCCAVSCCIIQRRRNATKQ